MPAVPRLGINQIQSAQGPQNRVDTSVNQEAFGLGNARSVAPDIAAFAQKIKNDADQVAAMEAENKLIEYQNKFLYDPKDGMIAKKGKDAFNLQNDLNESFAKTSSELIEGLSNPVQKALFEKAAAGRRADMDSQTMKYMSTQIQQYDDETTSAKITAEMNNAVNGYQDPELITKSMMRQEQAFVDYGNRHGLSPEVVKGKIEDAKSKTHSSIVSRMLANGDDLSAEAYYKANADGVLGTQKEAVEKELEIGSTRGKSQRFTDEVMGKGMNESQAYAEAAKIENPKVREATEQRINLQYTRKQQAHEQTQKDLFNNLTGYIDKNGSLDGVDPKVISRLDGNTKEAVDGYLNKNPIRDDGVIFYKLQQLAMDPSTRNDFAKEDLTKQFKNLSKSHIEQLSTWQASIRSKDGKADKQLDGAYSDSQVIENAYKEAGYDVKNTQEYSRYKNIVDSEVQRAAEVKGKKLTNDEIRSISEKQMMQTIKSSSFFGLFDSSKAGFQVSIDDLSDKEINDAKKLLSKKGMTPTDQNVLKVYRAKKQQGTSK